MAHTLPRFYYFANSVLRHLLLPVARVQVKVTGRENVPPEGALIVAMNHLSLLDPPLLGTYMPRDIEMMSKAENFEGNPLTAWVVRNYGAFPIHRGAADIGAIRHALQTLREGKVLLMAPEGTRSKSGHLEEPHEGIALIAVRSGAPILPVGLSGVERFPEKVRRWQATPVHISIGRPFRLKSPTRRPGHDTLTAMSEAVMERIAAELPPAYRGRFSTFTARQEFVEEL